MIEPLARHHTVIAPDFPATAPRRPAAATTRSAPSPPACATCCSRSATSGRRWSATRSAAARDAVRLPVPGDGRAPGARLQRRARARGQPGPARRGAARAPTSSSPRPPAPAAQVGSAVGRGLAAVGLRPNADVAEVARGYASLADADRRAAFLATLRAVVGTGGQRVDAVDRLYLAEALPVLIVWGARDPIIPVGHGEDAHEAIPGSRLEVFEDVGHLPQLEAPGRFVAVLERFLAETEPAEFDRDEWRARFARYADGAGIEISGSRLFDFDSTGLFGAR